MPHIDPRARLATALLLLAAALVAHTLPGGLAAYAVALLGVLVTGVARQHARFVLFAGLPLLVALLVLWGWLVPANHPAGYPNGMAYAVSAWLRIAACGAAVQALMIPLIDRPSELHRFLQMTRTPPAAAHVLLTAVIFMPEVGRRLARLVEARAAQGHSSHLLARIGSVPQLLAPLVSSLLDTADRRAEFWNHRGVLTPRPTAAATKTGPLVVVATVATGLIALAMAIAL